MKKILFTVALISGVVLNAATDKELKSEAKAAIMKMGGTLKAHMKQNMKKGGPTQAATFCSHEASNLAKEINQSNKDGISVKRVSLKYRNPHNAPTADEAKVLKAMQADLDANKKVPAMIVKQVAHNKYKVYKPIFINKNVCLKCHGTQKARDKNAYAVVKKEYPHDKAVGYKAGDLRGAFVVEIVK